MDTYSLLESNLSLLQQELTQLGLWSNVSPSSQALSSVEPFCIDTLEFHEWLQFVLIPRMDTIIKLKQGLPYAPKIAPAAQVYMRNNSRLTVKLIEALQTFDKLAKKLVA